jgi:hypothetical protein
MKVSELAKKEGFEVIVEGDFDREITGVYCCDLLSWVMGRAPADSAWLTVMGNMNSVAVAVLADVSCIILVENAAIDENAIAKAKQQEVNIFKTSMPAFQAAALIHECLS